MKSSSSPLQKPDDINYRHNNDPELRYLVSVNAIKLEEDIIAKLQIMTSSWNKMLQLVAWVIGLIVKKNREGIVAAQINKSLAQKDLTKVEKIVLKNRYRKEFEDVHKSFTNYCKKVLELGNDIGY